MANPTPTITFSVDLTPFMNETMGAATSEITVAVQELDNNGENTRSSFFPSLTVAPNRVLKHGDTFVEYGLKAVYLRDTYAVGYAPADRAYLTVVSVA
ncbi:MAG: hypothetical protein DWQ19_11790 [Crenarchaeota archaeon]|nr:MAG: hypothetical protein DWQ19_11790 [Thermoproteota archaeon]